MSEKAYPNKLEGAKLRVFLIALFCVIYLSKYYRGPFVVFVGLDWDTKPGGSVFNQDGSPPPLIHPSDLWIDSLPDNTAFLTNIVTVLDSLVHFLTLPSQSSGFSSNECRSGTDIQQLNLEIPVLALQRIDILGRLCMLHPQSLELGQQLGVLDCEIIPDTVDCTSN